MHYAELQIVPLGIRAGYPITINFEILSDRIDNIKDDLSDIIDSKSGSWFHDLALSIYNNLGYRKASTPMILMGRSDELRVNFN